LALQQLADETGLIIVVCHYPPGTSKWNRSSIACSAHHAELARHASGQPPHRHRTDLQHHDENRSEDFLRVDCNAYAKGIKVSDAEMASLNITRDAFIQNGITALRREIRTWSDSFWALP